MVFLCHVTVELATLRYLLVLFLRTLFMYVRLTRDALRAELRND
jgi:hypothetical protein